MLKSYFTIAVRSLLRRKGIAAINLVGLSVGLACCLLMALYVRHELSFDRSLPGAEQVARVIAEHGVKGELNASPTTPGPLGPALVQDLPEIAYVTRVQGGSAIVMNGNVPVQEGGLIWGETDFFAVFPFEMLAGDPATALREPGAIVLTASMAQTYFGSTDAVGESLVLNGTDTYTVTGVVADPSSTSSVQFRAVRSMITLENTGPSWMFEGWNSFNLFTYIRLRPEASLAAVEAKLPALVERNGGDELRASNRTLNLDLEPLADVYLHSPYYNPVGPSGNARNVYLFSLCAVFVLILACVNYMNLATARSIDRAKEVGIRMTVGAQRTQVASQFFGEALILCGLATVLALALTQIARPVFERLTGFPLPGTWLLDGFWLGAIVLITLVVGFLAGSFPALVLSRVQPAKVLKGSYRGSPSGALLRRGLVVFQFAISIALLAGTAVVFAQVRYMEGRDVGFETEQMLVVDFGGDPQIANQLEAVKQRLLQHPDVDGIAASQAIPGRALGTAGGSMEDMQGARREASISMYLVDYDFMDLYELEVIAGRGLSDEFQASDAAGVVINEAALRYFGYPTPEDALGKRGTFWGNDGEVVGVVRDFHQLSLKDALFPIAITYNTFNSGLFTLRLSTSDMPRTLAELETLWQTLAPQRPFAYAFLDEIYGRQYTAEQEFGTLFSVFAGLALFIACLGLVGLALFTTEQRAKEIGVRKVLGASVLRIVYVLTRDIAVLVGIAFLIATPFVWQAMRLWLNQFAYALPLGPSLFLAAGAIALLTALASVGLQAYRAAARNPLHSLRYE